MIKYIGSKRRLVPVIERIATASGTRTALDLFTGTTRVAQAFKRRGIETTAVDTARYSEVFARCYIEADATVMDEDALVGALSHLERLPGQDGYFTETFCRRSRYVQPFNGRRIDAIRSAIAVDYAGSELEPLVLTSLIEAADRVDSTTGLQMAYVKEWSQRSYQPLVLRPPRLLVGRGHALRGDACSLAPSLGSFDLAYLDPPYNQHRYYTNYHVWETLVAWDAPPHYGLACKRLDARDAANKSVFNSKRTMPGALRQVVRDVDCGLLVLSYNDESWITLDELEEMCAHHQEVVTLAFESARYVGARIGIHNPAGERVGAVSHLHNRELLVIAGEATRVQRVVAELGGRTARRGSPVRR